MAYRDIKFDTGFETWLDNTLSKIRTETRNKLQKAKGLTEEGSSKSYATFGGVDTATAAAATNNNSGVILSREGYEDIDQVERHTSSTTTTAAPKLELLADDLEKYELIDEEWEEFLDAGKMSGQQQREHVQQEAGFQAGGQFYTTVYGLEDDDDDVGAFGRDEYPQTPSARERVAKILQETELGAGGADHQARGQRGLRTEFNFDAVNYKAVKGQPEDVDNWSLEDEPAVTLDPSKLPYFHREAGDGKEERLDRKEKIYKLDNAGLDNNRNSQVSGSLDEFMDAQETLDGDMDIKTPSGKGRALLPMEDLELSFEEEEEESDENILDVEDEYGGSITIRPMSDTEPIIMDESQLQALASKRRLKVRLCVGITVAVMAVTGFSLVAYLTVHMLSK